MPPGAPIHHDDDIAHPPPPAAVRKLTCQEVLDQLTEYLDAEVQAELASEVDQHLGFCSNCRVEVDTIRQTILIFRCEERVELRPDLEQKLQQAMQRAYADGRPREGEEGTA